MMESKKSHEATKLTRCWSRTQASATKEVLRLPCKTRGMLFGDLDPVEYDSKIDPLPKACLKCWSFNHHRKFCPIPKTYDYCCNCGRKNLNVLKCPRCARAFQELDDCMKNWIYNTFLNVETNENDGNKRTRPNEENRVDETLDEELNELKDEDFVWEPPKSYHSCNTDFYTETNDLFCYMRAKKIVDEFKINLDETKVAEGDSFGNNSVTSIEDTLEKNEALSRLTGEPLRDFLNLLDAVKHLPVKTQDVVVLQFMSERKKHLDEKDHQFIKKSNK